MKRGNELQQQHLIVQKARENTLDQLKLGILSSVIQPSLSFSQIKLLCLKGFTFPVNELMRWLTFYYDVIAPYVLQIRKESSYREARFYHVTNVVFL